MISNCPVCHAEFNANGNRRYCTIMCYKKNQARIIKEAMITRAAEFAAWKTKNGCSRCGYSKCAGAIDLHHPEHDPIRSLTLGHRFGSKKNLEELSKCILLCANCHREVHHEERKLT